MIAALVWSSVYTRLIWCVFIFTILGYLLWKGGITLESVERIGKVADTVGGRILILVTMTMLFFIVAAGYGYYVLDAVQAGTLRSDDTLAIMLIQFVTGTAFGTAMGALVSLLGGKGKE
jgi:hypothetical protein